MAVKNYRVYQERRRRLAKKLGDDGVIFIPGATHVYRNADTEYPFRQESSFLYLTGWNEPNALLIITGGKNSQSTLFCNPKDAEQEIWTGKRFGPEGAQKEFGFHQTFAVGDMKEKIPELKHAFRDCRVIYYPIERGDELLRGIIHPCIGFVGSRRNLLFLDGDRLLGEMRLIKDELDVTQMAHAANISAEAHKDILSIVHPGMTEIELEAEFTYRFRKAGGDPCHAYTPIVAAGRNACTLHHTSTSARIRNGDLVLVDAGCEYEGYASDITRTFPANGTFTYEQRAIYEIVFLAQRAGLQMARPGTPLFVVHNVAARVITEGLMRLGLLGAGDAINASLAGAHRPFFPHGTSHWLGLDVHDVGDYINGGDGKKRRILEPGMVITVEPGIYIQPNTPCIDPRWLGIGVRIEDDVLITKDGNRVLSEGAPKEVAEIEAIMRHSRRRLGR
ncbi:MAG: aminopeptidase P N-terminal domain-containing protein [bacterium]|nr:aminopeptidase P N-terminal domain-containing protein [bacterium]